MIPIKPKTIRRLTRLVKALHPLLPRVPAPLPRPGSQPYLAPKGCTATESQRRQGEYESADSRRLDKGVIDFFAHPFSYEDRRR